MERRRKLPRIDADERGLLGFLSNRRYAKLDEFHVLLLQQAADGDRTDHRAAIITGTPPPQPI